MQKRTRIKLLIISAMFYAATAINIKAQTQKNDSAKSSRTIQAADDVCSQRLTKTLDALEAAEATVRTLQAAIEAQDKLAEIHDRLVGRKEEIIKSQSDLIKNYDKEKGVTISFFFGLLKIRKR